jgi:hypothetical protein
MRTRTNPGVPRRFILWTSLIGLVACSAAQDGQKGTVEQSGGPYPMPSIATATTATATASASPKPPAGPQDIVALPCGVRREHHLGDPPFHALSQQVPDRVCREDSDCGDGFCDRGICAPIWEDRYGQRCTATCQCGSFVCKEGRCRSCLHHAECVENGDSCAGYGPTTKFSLDCGMLGPHETHKRPDPTRHLPPFMQSPSP